MKSTIIQTSVATFCVVALSNVNSFAANIKTPLLPVQTRTIRELIFENASLPVAIEPQLMLFDKDSNFSAIAAPLWLLQRMETLRQLPPPTSEEVDIQLRAASEIRTRLENSRLAS